MLVEFTVIAKWLQQSWIEFTNFYLFSNTILFWEFQQTLNTCVWPFIALVYFSFEGSLLTGELKFNSTHSVKRYDDVLAE